MLASGGMNGLAYRSTDDGMSFVPWVLTPQPRLMGLAERNGVLYLAGKNYSDGWALATSQDEGVTIQPLSRYDDVRGVRSCAQSVCSGACDVRREPGRMDQRRVYGRAAGRWRQRRRGGGRRQAAASSRRVWLRGRECRGVRRWRISAGAGACARARDPPPAPVSGWAASPSAIARQSRACSVSLAFVLHTVLHTAYPHLAGPIAQRSELAAHNRLVPGSNPGGPTALTRIRVMKRERDGGIGIARSA